MENDRGKVNSHAFYGEQIFADGTREISASPELNDYAPFSRGRGEVESLVARCKCGWQGTEISMDIRGVGEEIYKEWWKFHFLPLGPGQPPDGSLLSIHWHEYWPEPSVEFEASVCRRHIPDFVQRQLAGKGAHELRYEVVGAHDIPCDLCVERRPRKAHQLTNFTELLRPVTVRGFALTALILVYTMLVLGLIGLGNWIFPEPNSWEIAVVATLIAVLVPTTHRKLRGKIALADSWLAKPRETLDHLPPLSWIMARARFFTGPLDHYPMRRGNRVLRFFRVLLFPIWLLISVWLCLRQLHKDKPSFQQ